MLTCLAIFRPPEAERMAASTTRGSHEKTRFTEEQMVTILREADKKSVQEVAKKMLKLGRPKTSSL